MLDYSQIQSFPDVNLVDTSVDDLLAKGLATYQSTYLSITGQSIAIKPGDDRYIFTYTFALMLYSVLQSINYAGRQNFLKYATGDSLVNLAANSGCTKDDPEPAVVTLQFVLGKAQTVTITIPQGTRATPGNNVYFATDEEAQIAPGDTDATVTATCLTTGTAGNGYIIGQINQIVDPVQYVASVTNTDKSSGGTDTESDPSLSEKTFNAPEELSVAGPSGAYESFARNYSSAIISAKAHSSSPGVVDLRVLLTGGTVPEPAFISELSDYLSARDKRPLTDNLTVAAPTVVPFDVTLTYYIDSADAGNAATINTAVTAAVSDYILWQKSVIGRDINPDELTTRIKKAGAKRAVITAPVYTPVDQYTAVAVANAPTITDGGVDGA
jgi:phage-related baseplate assembly protein